MRRIHFLKENIMTTHLRKPDFSGTYCGAGGRTTGSKDAAECRRCRKAAGLGAYDALGALRGLVVIQQPTSKSS
jgi:hypothetical protein